MINGGVKSNALPEQAHVAVNHRILTQSSVAETQALDTSRLLPIAARAANDWSKPCFGECDWDIKDAGVSGTIRVVSTAFPPSMYQRERN